MMLPLLGHLSDLYGRKALLTVPVAASIIPSGKKLFSGHSIEERPNRTVSNKKVLQ